MISFKDLFALMTQPLLKLVLNPLNLVYDVKLEDDEAGHILPVAYSSMSQLQARFEHAHQ